MKYLSDYIEAEQEKLFNEMQVFFAFSNNQFIEGRMKYGLSEDVKLTHLGAGTYIPTANIEKFLARHDDVIKKGIEQDIKENGKVAILQRELMNYEIGYSWEGINDPNFRSGINGYGFTEDEIQEQYYIHMKEHEY